MISTIEKVSLTVPYKRQIGCTQKESKTIYTPFTIAHIRAEAEREPTWRNSLKSESIPMANGVPIFEAKVRIDTRFIRIIICANISN